MNFKSYIEKCKQKSNATQGKISSLMSREFDSILKNENSKNDRLHDFKKIPNDHIQLNPFLRISSECKWFVHFFTFFKNQFFELPTLLYTTKS